MLVEMPRPPSRLVAARALVAVAVAFGAFVATGTNRANAAHAHPANIARDGRAITRVFRNATEGEVLGDITAHAPGVSWQVPGAESAVVRISVDGTYVTDDVVMEATPV